jgi:hypothetical protein
MMDTDKDGLVFTNRLTEDRGRFFLDKEEVYFAPECRGVAPYLLDNPSLWDLARIRLNRSDIRMKAAPVIGVSFSKALEVALRATYGFQKSMYELPDWAVYKGKAVIATMVAHTSASSRLVELEAWQLLDISDETFYVHCIIDKSEASVIHLDGATISHSKTERDEIRKRGCKIKGDSYQKHFRLDGKISITAAVTIMNLYFPLHPLTKEFLER